MAAEVNVEVEEIIAHFQTLEDPRSSINQQYPLPAVVVIAVLAVLAGCSGPTSMAEWAEIKAARLILLLGLPGRTPGKDVFRRVLMLLRPDAFEACFMNWLATLRQKAAAATGITQPIIAADGKTNRRSHDRKKGLGALHSVTLWASAFGLTLAQVACAEKSNEITALPELLRLTDITGAIITIDAMGTQKEIAATIVDRKADDVLALKRNHEKLATAVDDAFMAEGETNYEHIESQQTIEKGHGRVEQRTYYQMPAPTTLPGFAEWKGLQTIGMVVSEVTRGGGEPTVEIRYYLCRLVLNVLNFARAVRGHWGIENACHWSLDFTFREDESRIRERHLRQNMAWLNRMSLSLLKQHDDKNSVIMRRRACGWSEDYLLQVLTGVAT